MGFGTAWGGHFACTEENRSVRFRQGPPLYSSLAQWVERLTVNQDVAGSSPARGATEK